MTRCDILKKRQGAAYRILCGFLAFTFLFSWVLPPGYAQTGTGPGLSLLSLPAPGTMVTPTTAFTPALINGITIHPENPLEFDFIVGTGDENLQGQAFEEESTRLIKYFLASLTVPEDEMWVNLSPYEKDRIIPEGFGTTEMGRDLLAQDYILKQLTASLMYPEEELGSEFWKKIYQKAYEEYGTTEIPVNTFNKVWIVPEKAVVYEHGQSAFVVKSHLRVMLEEDYLAMQQESSVVSLQSSVSSTIIKEIILPAIEKEVNEGKSFANLRQIYNSAILAAWFKQNLKETLLGQVYVDKAKTKGVDVEDRTVNQKIYEQYLEAFKKGVYNYIKEDYDSATQEIIPRKYFSGGTNLKVGDLVETYKSGLPLTREHQEVLGEYLAGLKRYNRGQRRVNVNLVELSEEMSVAQAQEAIRQAMGGEDASSPVLHHPLEDMITPEMRTDAIIGAKVQERERSFYFMLNTLLPSYLQKHNDRLEEIKKGIEEVAAYLGRQFGVTTEGEYDLEYVRKVIEAEITYTVYKPQFENLRKIKGLIDEGKIHPGEITLDDELILSVPEGIREVSLGFWPQKVDPIHEGHGEMGQNWIAQQGLSSIFYLVDKMDFRKGDLSSIYLREPFMKALERYGMAPLVQYLPVMETEEILWGSVGEQAFLYHVLPEIVNKNRELIDSVDVIRLGYGAGVDHMQMYYKKDGVPDAGRPDVPGIFYSFVKKVLDERKGPLYGLFINGKLKIPLFFSGRDSDRKKFTAEELQGVIRELNTLQDQDGRPIIEAAYHFQNVSISSTEIRQEHRFWKLPEVVYVLTQAMKFPRWGYDPSPEEKTDQEQLSNDLEALFRSFLSGERAEEEVKSEIKEKLQTATGIALNGFDMYLNTFLINYTLKREPQRQQEGNGITLHHLDEQGKKRRVEEYVRLLQDYNVADEEKMFRVIREIQELLSQRSEQITTEALKQLEKKWKDLSSSPVAQGLQDYLQERQVAGEITAEEAQRTVQGVNDWLTRPGYPLKLVQKLKALIANQDWGTITESFYKEVDFGTAGKRGRQVDAQGDVLPGPNNINDYTVAEYTLGLARYLLKTGQQDRGVVLGGDTRIKSILPYRGEESYVELQAKILRKMGIKVYRFKEPRSIGHVAWTAVANDAASMEYNSASHNMWTDNGVKASNEFGAQLFTDERAGILGEIKEVEPEDIAAMNLDEFDLEADRGQNPGMHVLLGSQEDHQRDPSIVDADTGYIEANRRYVENMDVIHGYSSQVHSFYTPIQGAGVYTIPNILTDGEDFEFQVVLSQEQGAQDAQGRFGTVEKPDPNYINETTGARTLDKAIREAEDMERSSGVSFDFVFGTDPDADRSSYAVRDREGNWKVLKANDVWSLFAWYRLTQMARQGRLKTGTWAIETWVTTDLIADIAQDPRFDLKVLRPAVGFNKIAEVALREIVLPVLVERHAIGDLQELQRTKVLTLEKLARIFGVSSRQEMMEEINAVLKEFLLFGAEESNGYSPGGHTLEKDGAVAAVTFHEIAAFVKSINRNKEEAGRDDAFLKSYFEAFGGRDLTIDELLNRVYLQYGYYATENIPLTFDGLTGKAQKDQVLRDLADLAARTNEGKTVMLGDQRVQKAFSGKDQASTRNVEFKEVGYKFMLGEKDYIVTRPSGTEPYIRFYGQKYVPAVELSWDNIEAQKKTADDEIKKIVVAAQGEFDTGSSPAAAFKIRDNDEEGFTQDAGENKSSPEGSSPINGKLTMRDLNALAGKKVFIRTDFNVPLDGSGNIADDTRIRASLKTIRYAIDRGAKVIIGSHLGDPQKEDIEKLARAYQEREESPLAPQEALAQATREVESRFSLAPVAARLSQLLSDTSVNFSPNLRTMKDGREFIADSMRPGDILLLENVRFHRGEKKADAAFAADLFDGADVFILDAFGSAHRAHASIIGAPQGIPRVAGFLLAEETAILQRIQSGLRLAVMGGSKVSDKIRLMGTLLVSEALDYILIGGAMMNAFWKAKGRYVGASVGAERVEVDFARAFMNHHKVKLPPDGIAVDDFKNPTQFKVINFDRDEDVPFNWVVVDIGPRARKAYGSYILESGVTFWNGPMGAFDVASVSQFAQDGTKDIASMLAKAPGFTVVGGGDSLTAVNVFGFSEDDYDHLSTGGGASLKFLEEGMLPGIAALSDKIILPMDKQGLLPADDEADVVPEDLGLTAFLTPTQKVLRVLENRWQRGQMAVSLVEIMRLTGLEKEFVLAALETINSDPNISSFSVSPTGHNKKLNKETGWIELVLRPQLGGHRPPQQILRPGASPMVVQGQEEVGGINLDPALLDLQIKRDANFVPLPLPQQPIHSMNIEGFIPVIIHITPVTNLPMLLGLADALEGEDETVPLMKGRDPEEVSALN